ncbi:ABC transporter permease subunit [Kitasatospora sp. NPDC056327]|uniref:ABC transporter permease subunit n=1 Tax=Kitasatospora sp. NPDC056327 TaxID=3345785 RepID=UPI0035E2ED10
MSTTLTDQARPATRGPGRRLLGGLNWLVLRQHRAALITVAVAVVLGSAWMVHQRHQLAGVLDSLGWPDEQPPLPVPGMGRIDLTVTALAMLPVLLGVFLGAPLIAGDQERGTLQLVTTQSVSRRRWLTVKLAWCYGTALLAGTVLSAFFTWLWKPYRTVFPGRWYDPTVFDHTGPVLPALCLFLTAAGVTTGLLVRRLLPAMAITFAFAMAFQIAWEMLRTHLAPSRMYSHPQGGGIREQLTDPYELDRWIGSADGRLYGWGTCNKSTEAASDACLQEHGIVNDVIKYLDFDQMPAMQWTGAGLLLAAAAALTAVTLWRASTKP